MVPGTLLILLAASPGQTQTCAGECWMGRETASWGLPPPDPPLKAQDLESFYFPGLCTLLGFWEEFGGLTTCRPQAHTR